MVISRRLFRTTLMLLLIVTSPLHADPPITLNDGERILFLGNGFIENDRGHAYFETRLQQRFADKSITCRMMGWSGDTVRGSARTSGYQVPQGLARLDKEARAYQPTLIFLAYGMNESFAGPWAMPSFLMDYDQLLKRLAPLKARLILISPTYHEDLGRPFPDPAVHNRYLSFYVGSLREFAKQRHLSFIDLFLPLESTKKDHPERELTTNGLLLTQTGYALAAQAAEIQLGFASPPWEVEMDRAGKIVQTSGTKIVSVSAVKDGLRFRATDTLLPLMPDVLRLRIRDLPQGNYVLKMDGKEFVEATAAAWHKGVEIQQGPPFEAGEKLRAAIVQRNELFYRRWRPYNDHSRHWGFIGGDFKRYDEEIADQDRHIASLRRPSVHDYELSRKN